MVLIVRHVMMDSIKILLIFVNHVIKNVLNVLEILVIVHNVKEHLEIMILNSVHVKMDIITIIVRVTADNVTEFVKDVNKVDNV